MAEPLQLYDSESDKQGHEGCRMSGKILVDRVGGDFQFKFQSADITALKSASFLIPQSMFQIRPNINMTHVINQLSIGSMKPEDILTNIRTDISSVM